MLSIYHCLCGLVQPGESNFFVWNGETVKPCLFCDAESILVFMVSMVIAAKMNSLYIIRKMDC